MENFKKSTITKLQGIFLIISLLGTLAIILSESRFFVSLVIIVIIVIIAFTNMLWLQQLKNNVNNK